MKCKFYCCTLFLFFSIAIQAPSLFAQIQITVPSSGDTVLCNGGPITLHAINNGRVPINVNLGGTSVDDHYSVTTIPLGFSFNFYGNTYTSCVISSNGLITFNAADANDGAPWELDGGEGNIPLNQDCRNAFMGCYSDIYFNYSGQGGVIDYATVGTAPNRKFVVTFCNVPMYSNLNGCPNSPQFIIFQMILYETTNTLESYIKSKIYCTGWNGGLAIEGVENASGTAGTAVPGRNSTQWTANHDGKRFTPNSSFISYTDTSVPYIHIPAASAQILWFKGNPISGPLLATGDSLTVNPDVTTTYTALAVDCGDTSFAYTTVVIGHQPVISNVILDSPSFCGGADGSLTLQGMPANASFIISYYFNGLPQPAGTYISDATGNVVIPNLTSGIYDNIVAASSTAASCISQPVGPFILMAPIFRITGINTTDPHCDSANGTITLYGLTANQNITVHFNIDGRDTAINTTSGTDSTTISLLDSGTYSNLYATLDTCFSNTIGSIVLMRPPAIVITNYAGVNPSECGKPDGTITMYGFTPGNLDTVFYTLNGVQQTPLALPVNDSGAIKLSGLYEGAYSNIYAQVGHCFSNVIDSIVLVAPPLIPRFTYDIHFGCNNNDTVTFTNTTNPAGTVFYRWDFGDHVFDTATNPTHIYAQGTFYPVLIATNYYCIDSVADSVVLGYPIKTSFTVSPDTICQGQTVSFNNTSLGTLPLYFWDFGDSTGSTTDSATHVYTVAGVYKVMLQESDFVPCFDTAFATVYVDSISAINFSPSDSVICEGKQVVFTGDYSAIGNVGNIWTFGDGSVTTNTNPAYHAYNATGIMQVTLMANYRTCPDTSITKTVTVKPYPVINLGPDTSICPGSLPIALNDLTNASNPQARWLWNTGDTTSGILVDKSDTYFTTVTIDGCGASDSVWIRNDCYVGVPNAFTPNGDGINDYFFPRQMLSEGVISFSMIVYNRWGQQIFSTTNTDGRGWDGRFNNEMQPAGVYIYSIDVLFKNGQKEHHQGNVTLLN